jgi:hypothetical protein
MVLILRASIACSFLFKAAEACFSTSSGKNRGIFYIRAEKTKLYPVMPDMILNKIYSLI